jgi:type II secretory pathway pseudopilin PulG
VHVSGSRNYRRLGVMMGYITVISVSSAILLPGFFRDGAVGMLTACHSNLRNISTALEMYRSDNHGRLPARLTQLVPRYLRSLPTCPAASANSYSAGYTHSAGAFTVCCVGSNHASKGLSQNYPLVRSPEVDKVLDSSPQTAIGQAAQPASIPVH